MQKVGTLIRTHVSAPMPALIKKLNAVLRGWANYHRHVVASEAFRCIDGHGIGGKTVGPSHQG
jgi:RNA-directed DNA polymerase